VAGRALSLLEPLGAAGMRALWGTFLFFFFAIENLLD
jgi:hypothetical protein